MVVRNVVKYCATNRLTRSAVEVRQLDRARAYLKEIIRVCKAHLR